MPTLTLTLETFSIKSTWRAWLEMGETQYSTPTTGSADKTFDLSAILSGSTVTAATLSGATNGAGDSHAKYGGVTQNVTNAFSVSVLDWFGGMTSFGGLAVRFSFQAYGNTGANGTYSRTSTFSNVTLNVTYTLPFTKPYVTDLSLSRTTGYPGEQATLSWSAQSGVSNAVTAYKIYRADALEGVYALLDTLATSALTGSLSVSAPTPNGTYYYKVQPIGTASGYDGDMTQAVALTVVCTVTTPPATLTLSPAATHPNSASTLSWSGAGAGTNNPVTGYRVYRAQGADGDYALLWSGEGASAAVYAPNEDGGQYFYKVAAVGQYLTGGLSQTYATLAASYAQTSAFTLSANAVEAGQSVTLSLTGNALDQAHAVTVTFGDQTLSDQMAVGVLSQTLSIPLSWLNQIPDAVSGTALISVSTVGGGYVTGTLTVTAGADIVPLIGGGVASPSSDAVPAAWNVYVAGYSSAALSLPANAAISGAYGSRITGYRIECAGAAQTGASLPLTLTTGALLSGAYQARFIAMDSRGREGVQTLSINVQAYAMPYSSDLSAIRCDSTGAAADEGTYIKLAGTIIYASCDGHNSVVVSVRYRKAGDASWMDAGLMTGGSPMIIAGGGAAITDNYDVSVTMTDSLGNAPTRELTVPKSAFALHFIHSGGTEGAAFGKAAETSGLLDSAWPMRVRGAMQVDGALTAQSFAGTPTLADAGAWRTALALNSAANILTSGGGVGAMLAALGVPGVIGGVFDSALYQDCGYIKLGTSAGGIVIQYKTCTANGDMTAWGNVYYTDAAPGDWLVPMGALYACWSSVRQDSLTAPGWPGTVRGANTTNAGVVRLFQASATASDRAVTSFAIGTY